MTTAAAYYTGCELRTIDLAAGAVEYLWIDIEDKRKQDISAAAVQIALGSYDAPGTWHPADLTQPNGAVWKIRAALLIGSSLTYPTGIYWAWTKTTVGAETVVTRAANLLVQIIGVGGDSGLYGDGIYGGGLYGS